MTIKNRALLLIVIIMVSILCISCLVYAASEKLYEEYRPKGTFVSLNFSDEETGNGYLY